MNFLPVLRVAMEMINMMAAKMLVEIIQKMSVLFLISSKLLDMNLGQGLGHILVLNSWLGIKNNKVK